MQRTFGTILNAKNSEVPSIMNDPQCVPEYFN